MDNAGANPSANLIALPSTIFSSHILSELTTTQKKALRKVCKPLRLAINEEVTTAHVCGCLVRGAHPGQKTLTLQQVAADCPQLSALVLSDTSRNSICGYVLVEFLVPPNDFSNELATQPPGARLRTLDVKLCHFLSPCDMKLLIAACPLLQTVRTSRWADSLHLRALRPLADTLVELDLGDSTADITSITNVSLAQLPLLPVLHSLSLKRCIVITDAGVAHLSTSRLPSLTSLDLSCTRVTGISGFSGLRLSTLVLRSCRAFGNSGLAAVCATQAASLRYLRLCGCGVTPLGDALRPLAALPELRLVDLGPSWELDEAGLNSLASCPHLSELRFGNLNLRPARRPSPEPIGAVPNRTVPATPTPYLLPSLRVLSLGGMFGQVGLERLLRGVPALTSLELSGLSTVRDQVVGLLVGMRGAANGATAAVGGGAGATGQQAVVAGRLKELKLMRGGPDLTPTGLLRLAALPSLQQLTLVACACATESTVRQLQESVWQAGRRLRIDVVCGKRESAEDGSGGSSSGARDVEMRVVS